MQRSSKPVSAINSMGMNCPVKTSLIQRFGKRLEKRNAEIGGCIPFDPDVD
jgi:hypothetical protein